MYDSCEMKILQGQHDLGSVHSRHVLVKVVQLLEEIVEITSADELHHHEEILLGLERVVEIDYEGVVERGENVALSVDVLELALAQIGVRLPNDLHGVHVASGHLAHEEYASVRAATQRLDDLKVLDRRLVHAERDRADGAAQLPCQGIACCAMAAHGIDRHSFLANEHSQRLRDAAHHSVLARLAAENRHHVVVRLVARHDTLCIGYRELFDPLRVVEELRQHQHHLVVDRSHALCTSHAPFDRLDDSFQLIVVRLGPVGPLKA